MADNNMGHPGDRDVNEEFFGGVEDPRAGNLPFLPPRNVDRRRAGWAIQNGGRFCSLSSMLKFFVSVLSLFVIVCGMYLSMSEHNDGGRQFVRPEYEIGLDTFNHDISTGLYGYMNWYCHKYGSNDCIRAYFEGKLHLPVSSLHVSSFVRSHEQYYLNIALDHEGYIMNLEDKCGLIVQCDESDCHIPNFQYQSDKIFDFYKQLDRVGLFNKSKIDAMGPRAYYSAVNILHSVELGRDTVRCFQYFWQLKNLKFKIVTDIVEIGYLKYSQLAVNYVNNTLQEVGDFVSQVYRNVLHFDYLFFYHQMSISCLRFGNRFLAECVKFYYNYANQISIVFSTMCVGATFFSMLFNISKNYSAFLNLITVWTYSLYSIWFFVSNSNGGFFSVDNIVSNFFIVVMVILAFVIIIIDRVNYVNIKAMYSVLWRRSTSMKYKIVFFFLWFVFASVVLVGGTVIRNSVETAISSLMNSYIYAGKFSIDFSLVFQTNLALAIFVSLWIIGNVANGHAHVLIIYPLVVIIWAILLLSGIVSVVFFSLIVPVVVTVFFLAIVKLFRVLVSHFCRRAIFATDNVRDVTEDDRIFYSQTQLVVFFLFKSFFQTMVRTLMICLFLPVICFLIARYRVSVLIVVFFLIFLIFLIWKSYAAYYVSRTEYSTILKNPTLKQYSIFRKVNGHIVDEKIIKGINNIDASLTYCEQMGLPKVPAEIYAYQEYDGLFIVPPEMVEDVVKSKQHADYVLQSGYVYFFSRIVEAVNSVFQYFYDEIVAIFFIDSESILNEMQVIDNLIAKYRLDKVSVDRKVYRDVVHNQCVDIEGSTTCLALSELSRAMKLPIEVMKASWRVPSPKEISRAYQIVMKRRHGSWGKKDTLSLSKRLVSIDELYSVLSYMYLQLPVRLPTDFKAFTVKGEMFLADCGIDLYNRVLCDLNVDQLHYFNEVKRVCFELNSAHQYYNSGHVYNERSDLHSGQKCTAVYRGNVDKGWVTVQSLYQRVYYDKVFDDWQFVIKNAQRIIPSAVSFRNLDNLPVFDFFGVLTPDSRDLLGNGCIVSTSQGTKFITASHVIAKRGDNANLPPGQFGGQVVNGPVSDKACDWAKKISTEGAYKIMDNGKVGKYVVPTVILVSNNTSKNYYLKIDCIQGEGAVGTVYNFDGSIAKLNPSIVVPPISKTELNRYASMVSFDKSCAEKKLNMNVTPVFLFQNQLNDFSYTSINGYSGSPILYADNHLFGVHLGGWSDNCAGSFVRLSDVNEALNFTKAQFLNDIPDDQIFNHDAHEAGPEDKEEMCGSGVMAFIRREKGKKPVIRIVDAGRTYFLSSVEDIEKAFEKYAKVGISRGKFPIVLYDDGKIVDTDLVEIDQTLDLKKYQDFVSGVTEVGRRVRLAGHSLDCHAAINEELYNTLVNSLDEETVIEMLSMTPDELEKQLVALRPAMTALQNSIRDLNQKIKSVVGDEEYQRGKMAWQAIFERYLLDKQEFEQHLTEHLEAKEKYKQQLVANQEMVDKIHQKYKDLTKQVHEMIKNKKQPVHGKVMAIDQEIKQLQFSPVYSLLSDEMLKTELGQEVERMQKDIQHRQLVLDEKIANLLEKFNISDPKVLVDGRKAQLVALKADLSRQLTDINKLEHEKKTDLKVRKEQEMSELQPGQMSPRLTVRPPTKPKAFVDDRVTVLQTELTEEKKTLSHMSKLRHAISEIMKELKAQIQIDKLENKMYSQCGYESYPVPERAIVVFDDLLRDLDDGCSRQEAFVNISYALYHHFNEFAREHELNYGNYQGILVFLDHFVRLLGESVGCLGGEMDRYMVLIEEAFNLYHINNIMVNQSISNVQINLTPSIASSAAFQQNCLYHIQPAGLVCAGCGRGFNCQQHHIGTSGELLKNIGCTLDCAIMQMKEFRSHRRECNRTVGFTTRTVDDVRFVMCRHPEAGGGRAITSCWEHSKGTSCFYGNLPSSFKDRGTPFVELFVGPQVTYVKLECLVRMLISMADPHNIEDCYNSPSVGVKKEASYVITTDRPIVDGDVIEFAGYFVDLTAISDPVVKSNAKKLLEEYSRYRAVPVDFDQEVKQDRLIEELRGVEVQPQVCEFPELSAQGKFFERIEQALQLVGSLPSRLDILSEEINKLKSKVNSDELKTDDCVNTMPTNEYLELVSQLGYDASQVVDCSINGKISFDKIAQKVGDLPNAQMLVKQLVEDVLAEKEKGIGSRKRPNRNTKNQRRRRVKPAVAQEIINLENQVKEIVLEPVVVQPLSWDSDPALALKESFQRTFDYVEKFNTRQGLNNKIDELLMDEANLDRVLSAALARQEKKPQEQSAVQKNDVRGQ